MKSVSLLTILVASTQATRPPFDATHEVRRRMMQRKLALSGTITGFSLIDAETSTKLADLANGTVFDLSAMTDPTFNINASYTGSDIASVKFGHNGNPNVHMENYASYSFCGNYGPNFFDCSLLGVGNHTVTATPYSGRFAGGDAGASYTVSFSIVAGENAVPAPVMAPVPTPIMPLTPVPIGVTPPVPVPTYTSSQPELLVFKLSSSTVDVTSGPRTVYALVVFEDDGVEYSDISVSAYAPMDTSSENQNLASTVRGAGNSCSEPKPRDGGIGCNISLTFSQFLPEGDYGLNVNAYGESYYSISPQQLKDQLMPHFIEVVNSNPDTTPPVLLDFSILSPMILNVTSETQTLDLQIVLQDDLSGVAFGNVQGADAYSVFWLGSFNALESPYINLKAGQPNTFNVSVSFSNNKPPGNIALQLGVSDAIGNFAQFYNLSTIEIVNSAYDNSPPEVLGFVALSPTTVNVTSGPASIKMQVLVQDSISGVLGVSMSAERAQGPYDINTYLGASYSFPQPILGQAVLVNLSMTVPQYRRAGEYKLRLDVYDNQGNSVLYRADQLAKRNYLYKINVINGAEDFTPPKLLNLVALTPTTVNVSSLVTTVTFQVTVQDTVSGATDVEIRAYDGGVDNIYEVGSRNYNTLPIVGSPAIFNIILKAKQSNRPGNYDLNLILYDAARNSAVVSTGQLKKMNLPHSIEVINPDYDWQPPVLEDLVLLSSATVNVTLAPAILEVQVVVRDEISGFKQGMVNVWSYDFQPDVFESSVAFDPDAGKSMEMSSLSSFESSYYSPYNISYATIVADKKAGNETYVYNVSLPIPRYIPPGKYAIQLYLTDFADNGVLIGEAAMTELSFPNEIQVDNLILDMEPPVLVNFTALTPLVVNVTSGPAVIAFQATVQDALSGVYFGYFRIYGPGGNYRYYKYSETLLDAPIAGQPVVFNASFTLETEFFNDGLYKGTYEIAIGVSDHVGRFISLLSKDLIALGFPGTFVMV